MTPALLRIGHHARAPLTEEAIRKIEAESARRSTTRIDPAARLRPPEFPRRGDEPRPAPETPASPPASRRPPAMPQPEARPASAGAAATARARVEPRFDNAGDQEPSVSADPGEEMPRRPQPMPRQEGAASRRGEAGPRYGESNDELRLGSRRRSPRLRRRAARNRASGRRPAATTGLRHWAGRASGAPVRSGLRILVSRLEADELGGARPPTNPRARRRSFRSDLVRTSGRSAN